MIPTDCTYENIVKHYDALIKQINEATPEDAECMRLVVNKVLSAACFWPTVLPVYERWLREELAVDVGDGPTATVAKPLAPATHRNLHHGLELLKLPSDPTTAVVHACNRECTGCKKHA